MSMLLQTNHYEVKFLVAGESGLIVEFGAGISPQINALVQQLSKMITERKIAGVWEVVPTYRSLAVYFDPLCITRSVLTGQIKHLLAKMEPRETTAVSAKIIYIPVCYGGVFGPDLEYVARYTGLSTAEVIRVHTAEPYLVYMLGFAPGFPYLGGVPEQLMVPRKEKPLAKVPVGSVGIAGNQTGLYPVETSGEWWLIGRTPVKAFMPQAQQPFLVAPGDYIHFVRISIDEYFAIRREIAAGQYSPRISQQ